DSAGHVRQNFLVENHFALQPLRRLDLALIEPAAQPREDVCECDQPRCQDRHSSQKIMNGFICEALWLLHYRYPAGRLDRAERVEVSMLLKVSGFVLTDLINQEAALRCHAGIRLEIIHEKCGAVLIEDLKEEPIGKFDSGQSPANSFDQHRVANVAENCPVRRADCSHDIGDEPIIRQPRMNWRHNGFVGGSRLLPPVTGPKVLPNHLRGSRNRCNQRAIGSSKEHSVDIWMRIESGVKPLLGGRPGIWSAKNCRDFGKRLVVVNDGTAAAEIVTYYMAEKLNQCLSVAQ